MRIAYKPLVDRFNIPRPTLIEWQKKSDKKDWRTYHLTYLRQQLLVEDETTEELNMKGINMQEYFLWLVFIFFADQKESMPKMTFTQKLREFSFNDDFGVEYQHPFCRRIWDEKEIDGKKVRIARYTSLLELISRLTSAQYYCIQSILLDVVADIKMRLGIRGKVVLDGMTWQELYTLEKTFSDEMLKRDLSERKIIVIS